VVSAISVTRNRGRAQGGGWRGQIGVDAYKAIVARRRVAADDRNPGLPLGSNVGCSVGVFDLRLARLDLATARRYQVTCGSEDSQNGGVIEGRGALRARARRGV
jgi:hypothetical protein